MATQRKVIIGGVVCGALMICGFIFMYTARLEESNKETKNSPNAEYEIVDEFKITDIYKSNNNASSIDGVLDIRTQPMEVAINNEASFICGISSVCDVTRLSKTLGATVDTIGLKSGRKFLYVLPVGMEKADNVLFMFPGTNAIACQFALKAQPLIERALFEGFAVAIFQAECPYCEKRQFRLEKSANADLQMVQDVRNWLVSTSQGSAIFVYGFSEGAVFSMLVNDVIMGIKALVVDAGFHPSQLKMDDGSGTCSMNFVDNETVSIVIKSTAKILLNCGEKDAICNKAQPKLYAQILNTNNVKLSVFKDSLTTSVNESIHTPHLDSGTLETIFGWAYHK